MNSDKIIYKSAQYLDYDGFMKIVKMTGCAAVAYLAWKLFAENDIPIPIISPDKSEQTKEETKEQTKEETKEQTKEQTKEETKEETKEQTKEETKEETIDSINDLLMDLLKDTRVGKEMSWFEIMESEMNGL
jgi:hypothetical protein